VFPLSLTRRWEPLDRRQRLKILCRINGVLVVCAACFLVRVAVLSSALFVRSRHRCAFQTPREVLLSVEFEHSSSEVALSRVLSARKALAAPPLASRCCRAPWYFVPRRNDQLPPRPQLFHPVRDGYSVVALNADVRNGRQSSCNVEGGDFSPGGVSRDVSTR